MHRANPELDTIDGVEADAVSRELPPVLPIVQGGALDYPELVTVERRHYQVAREIAKGGMGRVLEARDLRLGRTVAIKELLPRNRDLARRFEREARITARLQHPAIIHVYEAGVWNGGEPFYAMTKVTGRSLDKVVAERPTLAERLALLPNVIAVADALAYAHSEHVIHRDLKPANILVGAFGETVVIDWGLAKDLGTPIDPAESMAVHRREQHPDETNAGSVVGTPAYMPPEQARGEAVDARADVYAIGALLYKLLAGAPPFAGTSSNAVLELVKTTASTPVQDREPGTPPDLAAIVAKAMARDRDDRYADAGELAADLKRFYTGRLVAARRYSHMQLFVRWLRRYRLVIAILAIAIVVLGVVGVVSVSRIVEEKRNQELRRNALLEESGRSELLVGGHAGKALAYLAGAAHDGRVGGARGFLIAEAVRPFEAEVAAFDTGEAGGAIAYSPDGRVATAAGTSIQLWSANGERERVLAAATHTLRLAFDPSGKRLAAAGDDRVVRVWSADGTALRELRGHQDAILDIAFDATGERIVTASADATARVWTLATGQYVASTSCHHDAVIAARFSPDGRKVVSASRDHGVCMWYSAGEAVEMMSMPGHTGRITTLRWSADSNHVLTASADGTARLWSPRHDGKSSDKQEVGKLAMPPLRHELGVTSAELSADGRRILTAGVDNVAIVWEVPELVDGDPTRPAQLLVKLVGHADAIERAVFDSEDRWIATAGRDGKAKVWDAESGQLIATFEHAGVVTAVAFSADRRRLFTTGQDGTARVWDIQRGAAQLGDSEDLSSVVKTIAVAGNDTVATASEDSKVTLLRPGTAGRTRTVLRGHEGRVFAVAFSPDGRWLASAGDDAELLVWDVATGARVRALGAIERDHPVRAIAWSPDGGTIAAATGAQVKQWAADGAPKRTLAHVAPIVTLAYHGDGARVLATTADGKLVAWDPTSGAQLATHVLDTGAVQSFALSRDGTRIVVGGKHDARLYHFAGGALGREILRLDGPFGEIRALAFTPDDSRAITAGADGIVRLWDLTKGKLVGTRDPRGGALTSIALTADGNTLWAASRDHMVRAWDIRVELRSAPDLDDIIRRRVPWRLGDDDVVRLLSERGERDGKR